MDGYGGMNQGAGYGQSQQLDPELVQAILAMQQQVPQQNQMARQLKMADQMRADSKGQLAGKQVGQVYVAPNVSNLAANLMGGYKAGQMDKDVSGKEDAMGRQNSAIMQRYFDALRGRGGMGLGMGGMGGMGGSAMGPMAGAGGGYGMDY